MFGGKMCDGSANDGVQWSLDEVRNVRIATENSPKMAFFLPFLIKKL